VTVRRRLVLSSALMLFLELALIRWTGANVVHLSYFTNFVLLGSFLGVGLGFLRQRPGGPPRPAPYYSPVALALLVAFVTLFPVAVDRGSGDVIYFSSLSTTGPPLWLTLPLLFLAVAVVMAGPGELVAGCFASLPRLEAYRYDLIGSLLGIGAFTVLSFLRAPSLGWGVIVVAAFLALLGGRARLAVVGSGVVVVVLLAIESLTPGVSWSPYYKVSTDNRHGSLHILVNGVPHQRVTGAGLREQQEPQYALPYERAPANNLGNVLIIGAGSGSDVAIALAHGAGHVDAVEIDPRLHEIGEQRNPDRPYADPRVRSVIDDGRAYLERTDERYDLVLFALPDSLTLVNGASSLRLESYLFTRQAFAAAREHLAPGGAFAMYNYYRQSWLVDRLAGTAAEVFGHPPCVDVLPVGQQAVITAGLTAADQSCASAWTPSSAAAVPAPSSDDRPFLYLRDRSIPPLYLVTLLLVLAASVLAVRVVAGPLGRMRPYRDLFLLGSGFLLLETKSVTGFALLFGTTWVVNAIVFAGVLCAVLAAVELTARRPTPPLPVMYAVLGAGLVVAWLVPPSWLLVLPVPLRLLAAVLVAFTPVFAANVVFAKRFAEAADPTTAFGANLLGAILGGCLEYLALVVGYRGLLVVAGALYLGAFALRPRVRAALTL